jgi:hypothetical protein
MTRSRLVCAVAVGSIALGACYRDRAPGGAAEARAERARAAASRDPLAFLPMDAELVIGVDARQIFASPLWKQLQPRLEPQLDGAVRDFRAACGYDPLGALRGVTLGMRIAEPIDGVIVLRGLPRDKTMACVGRALARQLPITIEGGVITVPSDGPGDPPLVMAFADATTLVIATSRGKLDAALASGAPLRRSRAFSELWARVDARHAIWAVANGGASAFDGLALLGARPRAVLGSIALAGGLSLAGRLRLDTPDEATQLASLGQGQLGPVQAMVERVELGAEGTDVTLRIEVTWEQAESLAAMALMMWRP